MISRTLFTVFILVCGNWSFAQPSVANDSIKFDFGKISALCLDGKIGQVLAILKAADSGKIRERDSRFKTEFEKRFRFGEDKSNFLQGKKSAIDDLLKIYRDYWRLSFLNDSLNNDSLLAHHLSLFFNQHFNKAAGSSYFLHADSLHKYLIEYVGSFGFHTTGFGNTGKFKDLLVWKTEKDTVYNFTVHKDNISSKVVFMDDFITLGWEEYATLGRNYPGGWATREALYCVKRAYNLNSESFLIGYLAHEGRHFSDYKLFPKLSSADLEYRSKLTELSLASETLYNTITTFINGADYNSTNSHSVANYCVIRDLSKRLFNTEFEKDISKWRQTGKDKINTASYKILVKNKKALRRKGKGVEKYIKM